VSSSKHQWAAKGRDYFSHRLYKLAAACFTQATQPIHAKLSLAYHQMTQAKLKRLRGDTPAARTALLSAAEELGVCAGLEGLGDTKNIYYHAGTCFEAVNDLFRAATSFVKAGRHEHAVQLLFNAQDFSRGIDLLLDHRERLKKELFDSLLESARLHFFRRRVYRCVDLLQCKSERPTFVSDSFLPRLFDHNVDAQIAYAKKHGFRVQLQHILDVNERYDELAEIYLAEDDLDRGILFSLKAFDLHHSPKSVQLAVDTTVTHVESTILVEGRYRKTAHEQAKRLVEAVQPYASVLIAEACLYVSSMYYFPLYRV
jgi:hypothetical protein